MSLLQGSQDGEVEVDGEVEITEQSQSNRASGINSDGNLMVQLQVGLIRLMKLRPY